MKNKNFYIIWYIPKGIEDAIPSKFTSNVKNRSSKVTPMLFTDIKEAKKERKTVKEKTSIKFRFYKIGILTRKQLIDIKLLDRTSNEINKLIYKKIPPWDKLNIIEE